VFENIACLNYLAIEPTFDERGRCSGFYVRGGHTPTKEIASIDELFGKHIPRDVFCDLSVARLRGLGSVLRTGIARRVIFSLPSEVVIDTLTFKTAEHRLGILYSRHSEGGTVYQRTCLLLRGQASAAFTCALLSALQTELRDEP